MLVLYSVICDFIALGGWAYSVTTMGMGDHQVATGMGA